MPERSDTRNNHNKTDQCPHTGRKAPTSVKGSHDCPPIKTFNADPLCIQRNIAQIPEHPEREKAYPQHINIHCRPDSKQRKSISHNTDLHHNPASQFRHQITGQRNRYELSDRNHKQHHSPIESIIYSKKFLYIRNTARPTGKAKSLSKKEGKNSITYMFFRVSDMVIRIHFRDIFY